MLNENWAVCDTCGEKRMIDPDTGDAEPCANCRSVARKTPLFLGLAFLGLAAVAIVGLLLLALTLLNG